MIFTIGQVTKMYNISHDTLRYYDKIDLLKPSIKKENGYRYYTIREIELLEIILVAKQLGLSMKDIKHIIEKEDEDTYIELFKSHKEMIEEKIEHLKKLKGDIQTSIDIASEAKAFENGKEEPKEVYIDKDVVYFKQDNYNEFYEIIQNKSMLFKVEKTNDTNEMFKFNEEVIGVEIEDECIKNKSIHEKIKYKGRYIEIKRKDSADKLGEFIKDNIYKIYGENYTEDIKIVIESIFTLFKKDNQNIYYVKILIENKK